MADVLCSCMTSTLNGNTHDAASSTYDGTSSTHNETFSTHDETFSNRKAKKV
jgi:hypothetical protein